MFKKGTAYRLNEESYESYYWLGFICADGHISNNRLKVTLSNKDVSHLIKLSYFLGGCPIKIDKQCSLSIMDTKEISKLVEKYHIVSNKTENPIDFNAVRGLRNRLSFITGFIDGDGCIGNLHKRRDFNLRIKCHESWQGILSEISLYLIGKNRTSLNNQGYASLSIGDSQKLKQLKRTVLKLGLPILVRKWDIINLEYVGRQEQNKKTLSEIKKLLRTGKSQIEVSKILNLSKSTICLNLKRNKINYESIKNNQSEAKP